MVVVGTGWMLKEKEKKTDTWIPENKRNKSENRDRNKLNSNSSKEVQCQK